MRRRSTPSIRQSGRSRPPPRPMYLAMRLRRPGRPSQSRISMTLLRQNGQGGRAGARSSCLIQLPLYLLSEDPHSTEQCFMELWGDGRWPDPQGSAARPSNVPRDYPRPAIPSTHANTGEAVHRAVNACGASGTGAQACTAARRARGARFVACSRMSPARRLISAVVRLRSMRSSLSISRLTDR